MHKCQVDLDESRQKNKRQTEKIKLLEARTEEFRNEISELIKVKERLTEQNGFFEKSYEKKKQENHELSKKLNQAETQIGDCDSVLNTVRNLESKNEILRDRMSSVLLSTEEEVSKVRTEQERYTKLIAETSELNKQNTKIHSEVSKAKKTEQQHLVEAKVKEFSIKSNMNINSIMT